MRHIPAAKPSTGQKGKFLTLARDPSLHKTYHHHHQASRLDTAQHDKKWPKYDTETMSYPARKAIYRTAIHPSTSKAEHQIVLQDTITGKNNADDARTPIYAPDLAHDTGA
jgi:hypothetical protein